LDGGSAAVTREERGVNVKAAMGREFKNGGWKNLSVSGDNDEVGLKGGEFLDSGWVVKFFWLQNLQG